MNSDPTSLDNLRDVVELAPVSWWPMASGWWVLFAALSIAFAAIAYRRIQKWRANAYRRAALQELQSATSVARISEILKRTALAAYPRAEVASLSGIAWSNWLGTVIGEDVPMGVSESLARGVFAGVEDRNTAELSLYAAKWIHQHRPPC